MKLNWGHALLIFFIIFIGILVRVVIKSRQIDHSLVVDEYYKEDIAYQKHLDKLNNRKLLKEDLDINYETSNGIIVLDFHNTDLKSGTVQFYRPSNKSSDYTVELSPNNNGTYEFPTKNMGNGKWDVNVEWNDGQRSYIKSKNFYIQNR